MYFAIDADALMVCILRSRYQAVATPILVVARQPEIYPCIAIGPEEMAIHNEAMAAGPQTSAASWAGDAAMFVRLQVSVTPIAGAVQIFADTRFGRVDGVASGATVRTLQSQFELLTEQKCEKQDKKEKEKQKLTVRGTAGAGETSRTGPRFAGAAELRASMKNAAKRSNISSVIGTGPPGVVSVAVRCS